MSFIKELNEEKKAGRMKINLSLSNFVRDDLNVVFLKMAILQIRGSLSLIWISILRRLLILLGDMILLRLRIKDIFINTKGRSYENNYNRKNEIT